MEIERNAFATRPRAKREARRTTLHHLRNHNGKRIRR